MTKPVAKAKRNRVKTKYTDVVLRCLREGDPSIVAWAQQRPDVIKFARANGIKLKPAKGKKISGGIEPVPTVIREPKPAPVVQSGTHLNVPLFNSAQVCVIDRRTPPKPRAKAKRKRK